MNKNQWMNELYSLLAGMPEPERREIMMDYEEHFAMAYSQGKNDVEIIQGLGDPRFLARQYNLNHKIDLAQNNASPRNLLSAVFATTALGFFNLVIVLGPFLGLVGVLIGLYGAAFGVAISGVALTVSPLIAQIYPAVINLGPGTNLLLNGAGYTLLVSTGVGLSCLGALFIMGCFKLTKVFYRLTMNYLKWNADIILRRKR